LCVDHPIQKETTRIVENERDDGHQGENNGVKDIGEQEARFRMDWIGQGLRLASCCMTENHKTIQLVKTYRRKDIALKF
jgi:hypothetical protein